MLPVISHTGNHLGLIVDARCDKAFNHRHDDMMLRYPLRLLRIQSPGLASDGKEENLTLVSLSESQAVPVAGRGGALDAKPSEPAADQERKQQRTVFSWIETIQKTARRWPDSRFLMIDRFTR